MELRDREPRYPKGRRRGFSSNTTLVLKGGGEFKARVRCMFDTGIAFLLHGGFTEFSVFVALFNASLLATTADVGLSLFFSVLPPRVVKNRVECCPIEPRRAETNLDREIYTHRIAFFWSRGRRMERIYVRRISIEKFTHIE